MSKYLVEKWNTEGVREKEEVEADGYAVDNNSNLFFFMEEVAIEAAPGNFPQQRPPKPTTTFAKGEWFRVDKA